MAPDYSGKEYQFIYRSMRIALLSIVAAFVVCVGVIAQVASSPQADFYVSVRGSDNWSGTLPTVNEKEDDGPFASLERARDAVRELMKSRSGDIVVYIRGGPIRWTKRWFLDWRIQEGATRRFLMRRILGRSRYSALEH